MSLDFEAVALNAVLALRRRADPGSLPEDQAGWNETFVRAIRALKDQFRDSPDLGPLLEIASDQLYGRDIHWALELIQNAEDAGSRHITFVFQEDRVVVMNDGEAFTAADVWGVCSAGHSPKKNKIGFFGIGFKSVVRVTDAPEIFSGPYAFRILDKIYPEPLPASSSRARGARFVLPIRSSERHKLKQIVTELTSPEFLNLLLTLRTLQSIRVVDGVGDRGRGRFYRFTVGEGVRDQDDCRIGGSWPGCDEQIWRRHSFATEASPADIARHGRERAGGERSTIVLARPVDRPIGPTKLHCFLPLDVQSELRWLVQADFDPTPGRERLRENAWNQWLMGQVGVAIAAAVREESTAGAAPWPLIPLEVEVPGTSLQRPAFDQTLTALRSARFVKTGSGWRPPPAVAVPQDEAVREVVREIDLRLVTSPRASYVSSGLSPDDPAARSRMVRVLAMLGAQAVGVAQLIELLKLDDDQFRRREPSWWLRALDRIAREADPDQSLALAKTRCIPIAGGGRVRPSPPVALDGYLVAYSRSGSIADLRRYFKESEVHLVDPALDPVAGALRARTRGGAGDEQTRVRDMLTRAPFGVALEAGPYHVVEHLVIPRMEALAGVPTLSAEQRDQLFRMLEFVRHRWRGYVADHKRARRLADEGQIATELGARLRVVANVGPSSAPTKVARRLTESYIPSRILGRPGMDVVLAGKEDVCFIDPIHAETIAVPRGKGISRGKGAQLPPEEFLRLLGAPIGPIVAPRRGDSLQGGGIASVNRSDVPWVRWNPSAAGRQLGLVDDFESNDIEWLVSRWSSLTQSDRRKRGKALWALIEGDWSRLSKHLDTQAAYHWYSWRWDQRAWPATWRARLQSLEWIEAADGSLRRPAELVRPTPSSRLALGDQAGLLLAWPTSDDEVADRLGVRSRPSTDQLLDALTRLRRNASSDLRATQRAASACYDLLAANFAELAPADREEAIAEIRPRFQGNSKTGLIFAPPPHGLGGRHWWPASRTIRADAAHEAGPFLGQLAGRYPKAGALWDALEIQAALSPELIVDAIRLELSESGQPADVVQHYYGELVSRVERSTLPTSVSPLEAPALSNLGWSSASHVRWTNRTEVRAAFKDAVAWWTPGTYDPSILQRAARWLGIREIDETELTEEWDFGAEQVVSDEVDELWRAAVSSWAPTLRAEGGWMDQELEDLADSVAALKVAVVSAIAGALTLTVGDTIRSVASRPDALRLDRRLIATSEAALFSLSAARALATFVPSRRLAATHTLAALLANAHQFRSATTANVGGSTFDYSAAKFVLEADEVANADEMKAALVAIGSAPAPEAPHPTQTTPPPRLKKEFADPSKFEITAVRTVESPAANPDRTAVGGPKRNRPPKPEHRKVDRRPKDSQPIPPNTAIEDAARPFIEKFELQRGVGAIHRQGGLVGADYIAADGRFIELKATGGVASDAFDLERSEWHAALDPASRDQFWVYIVEHLTDGEAPEVTAIRNPVTDSALRHDPVGKMRVTGWRSAQHKQHARFALSHESDSSAATIGPPSDQPEG